MFLSAFELILPTTGGTAACAAVTGPGAVLCIGVGGVALTLEAAVAVAGLLLGGHGGAVLLNNANNPLQISKKDSEMQSYEDAKREGKMGEAEHIDDGKSSNPDFKEIDKQYVDIKKPSPPIFRSIEKQAADISKKVSTTSSEVRFIVDLVYLKPQDKTALIQELKDLGTDMSRISFINQ